MGLEEERRTSYFTMGQRNENLLFHMMIFCHDVEMKGANSDEKGLYVIQNCCPFSTCHWHGNSSRISEFNFSDVKASILISILISLIA